MMLMMLCGLFLAQANGLVVPDKCWCVFAIAFFFNLFLAVIKIDNKGDGR